MKLFVEDSGSTMHQVQGKEANQSRKNSQISQQTNLKTSKYMKPTYTSIHNQVPLDALKREVPHSIEAFSNSFVEYFEYS